MHKSFLFILTFFFVAVYATAQTNSFGTVAAGNNKTWVVSKCFVSSTQQDHKELFNNYTFQFREGDTANIVVTDIRSGGSAARKGYWREQSDNTVRIILPYEQNDKDYFQVAVLLNKGVMEKVSLTSSLLSFKIPDVMSNILIEFSEK